MDPIAINRDVGCGGPGHRQKLMRHALEVVEYESRFKAHRIHEDHLAAHFVDGNQPSHRGYVHVDVASDITNLNQRELRTIAEITSAVLPDLKPRHSSEAPRKQCILTAMACCCIALQIPKSSREDGQDLPKLDRCNGAWASPGLRASPTAPARRPEDKSRRILASGLELKEDIHDLQTACSFTVCNDGIDVHLRARSFDV